MPNSPDRMNVLGVAVDAINMTSALHLIEDWVSRGRPRYVVVRDVHGVVASQRDKKLRSIHNHADLVTPDGVPLVWLAKLRGHRHVERVYGPDLMLETCRRSEKPGWRHFFYGGAEGVAEALVERLREKFPHLQVAGTFSPPFRLMTAEEDAAVCQQIRDARPDIIWVGLGTPKQEQWMAEHVGRLGASVLIGVGAAFDFHSKRKPQAPRWMQRSGLEWLFRMLTEPRRLGPRYLRNNPAFLWLILLQSLRLKRYSLD
jgi:N-acetylglucosaminyldiphosphoundecaprenol N-acetyl-beta-D-mannosaminyltransferase